MVRNITKGGTTQIVKIHIGDKGKKEEPKKKRTYKRKPKKPVMPSGTGNSPWTGVPLLGSPPMQPMPPISRMGWSVEPLQQIRRLDEPPIQRIEHNQQMNFINPPRQLRDYVAQMLEQSSPPRIEYVAEPKSMRIEEPASPVEVPQEPLVPSLPSSEKRPRPKPPVSDFPIPPIEIPAEEEPYNPTATKTGDELRSLRDRGLITAEFLNQFNSKRAKEGNMTLLQVANRLGIPIPRGVANTKSAIIQHILENL
jgi:hypothetical protein